MKGPLVERESGLELLEFLVGVGEAFRHFEVVLILRILGGEGVCLGLEHLRGHRSTAFALEVLGGILVLKEIPPISLAVPFLRGDGSAGGRVLVFFRRLEISAVFIDDLPENLGGLVENLTSHVEITQFMVKFQVLGVSADDGLEGESRRGKESGSRGGFVEQFIALGVIWIGGEDVFLELGHDAERILFDLALQFHDLEGFAAHLDTALAFVLFHRRHAESLAPVQKAGLLHEDGLDETHGIAPVTQLHCAFGLEVELSEIGGELVLPHVVFYFRCVYFFRHNNLGLR